MRRTRQTQFTTRSYEQHNANVLSKRSRRGVAGGSRARTSLREAKDAFIPPEDWHEPREEPKSGYRIVVQSAGEGFQHVVTPAEIRARLAQVPQEMLRSLDVVQLSCMTKKKRNFPCYGMQWGTALYLYPIEEGLMEYYGRPPKPMHYNEARMYGGRWVQEGATWKLQWTLAKLKDFYLNNILIHELGHLLDDRNTTYAERERYAEWFAVEFGYKPSRQQMARKAKKLIRRRHHAR